METPPTSPVYTITRYSLIVLAAVVFGIVVRSYDLGQMALHHDESIHAWYSYLIYQGDLNQYKYDPTYHGPFLYHSTALIFAIFGDNDATSRLPMVLFGILLLYFIWRLKPWIGPHGVLFTMILAATSPTLSYFSRFARNDMFMAAMAMGVIVFALEYMRSKRTVHLVGMTFWLALMYCTKENSYMTGFVLGSFLTFYAVYYVWSFVPAARKTAIAHILVERGPLVKLAVLYALFSFTAFTLVFYVCYHDEFHQMAVQKKLERGESSLSMPILHDTWFEYIPKYPWIYPLWLFGVLTACVVLMAGYTWLRRKVETPPQDVSFFSRVASNNLPVMLCILVAVSVYSFLFTTMGTNPIGMSDGTIDYLLYWMGQQGTPRIPGPPDYFLGRLFVYELAAVLLGIVAYVVYTWKSLGFINFFGFQFVVGGVVYMYWNRIQDEPVPLLDSLPMGLFLIAIGLAFLLSRYAFRLLSTTPPDFLQESEPASGGIQPDGIRWFFIYWSLLAVLIYAMLEEKVPWLMVHQAQPLILLAGVFMGDVVRTTRWSTVRTAVVVLFGVLTVYQAAAAWKVNIVRPDDARELIVYNNTEKDVVTIVDHIKHKAELLGADYQPGVNRPSKPILAYFNTVQEGYAWPMVWYFRHYNTISFNQNSMPSRDVPFILTVPRTLNQMKVWSQGKYTFRRMNFRNHWEPSGNDGLPFAHFQNSANPLNDSFSALWNYMIWRTPWSNPGSMDMIFMERQPLLDTEAAPEVPKGYDRSPQPLQILASVGSIGGGETQLNEPRGVALSPDEQTVYVLDSRNGRIQVFDTNLNYVSTIGSPGTGAGQFTIGNFVPNGGIDVGPDGTIYATDTWGPNGGRVLRFRPDGTPLTPIAPPATDPFYFPRGLAVGPNGQLYVSDTGNHRIVRFDAEGRFQRVFAQGEFKEPVGITVGPNGRVYVCDVDGQRVIAYTPAGQYERQWKILGWEPDAAGVLSWIEPYIALDPAGNLYVTDSTTNTLHVFHAMQDEVFLFGRQGLGASSLNRPKGIAVSSRYEVFIADTLNHRLIKARAQPSSM